MILEEPPETFTTNISNTVLVLGVATAQWYSAFFAMKM